MTINPEQVANLVQAQFHKLPAKRKPAVRDNGLHEWVPLSGIVAESADGELHCLAVATGMKCLPSSKLHLAKGNVIHDWHAEILAIRSFNRFILDECQKIAAGSGYTSHFIQTRNVVHDDEVQNDPEDTAWHGQPFAWKEDVTLHMYCSEAPCGDASMELTMAAQDDASPWELPAISAGTSSSPSESTTATPTDLPGRGFFSQLGVVRRKPARADAPPTLSKSCSDKLSLQQCSSLLSSITSLFVSPENVYLSTVIMPESQFSSTGCGRAFTADKDKNGRMLPLLSSPLHSDSHTPETKRQLGGYRFHPFHVLSIPEHPDDELATEFHYSKRSVTKRATKISASNFAVAWTASGLEEGTLGGVLQGRKQFDARGASATSRQKMWASAVELAHVVNMQDIKDVLGASRLYKDLKGSRLLGARAAAKDIAKSNALKGWARNEGDDDFEFLQHAKRGQ